MAYSTKNDYCGLTTAINPATGSALIELRSDNENASQSTYAPVGETGGVIGIEVYGHAATPSNVYALKGQITATEGKIKLGAVQTINTKKFRLTSVKFTTAANSAVGISAAAVMVEDAAVNNDAKNYVVPAFTLDTAHVAQDIFSAFSVTGTGANLIACDAEAKLDADIDTLVGEPISNGVGNALLVVSGTILVKGDIVPTIAVTTDSGFVVTKAPTCDNPETAYKSYAFEITKPLALYVAPVAG